MGAVEDGREELFHNLRARMSEEMFNEIKEHFADHVEKDGIELAYQCLMKLMMAIVAGVGARGKMEKIPLQWLLRWGVTAE